MDKVKLELNGMSAAEKTRFAYAVGVKLIDNEATFPDQPVAGADLTDFADAITQAMTDAHVARVKWRELVSTVNGMLATLDGYLRQTASYVENVSAGNAAIIELAGLQVRQPSRPVGPLRALQGLTAAASRNPGEVDLKWTREKGARVYMIQYSASADLPGAFEQMQSVTRTKHTIKGLARATRYWFRVAALGAAGPSPWSNAVSVVTQ